MEKNIEWMSEWITTRQSWNMFRLSVSRENNPHATHPLLPYHSLSIGINKNVFMKELTNICHFSVTKKAEWRRLFIHFLSGDSCGIKLWKMRKLFVYRWFKSNLITNISPLLIATSNDIFILHIKMKRNPLLQIFVWKNG